MKPRFPDCYVFMGSTLSHEAARRHLDACFLPPVQQGDVMRLLHEGTPRAIGIVDGLFRAVPAVWHKEILMALERGCHVFGAASMGALRAAELHPFGMRGVGSVFARYADGTYEDDDEVAVAHAQAEYGYRELSVAMVNLRDVIEGATDARVLTSAEAGELIAHAKSTPYPQRTFGLVVHRGKELGWPQAKVTALKQFIDGHGPLLKERDAVEMLGAMRTLLESSPGPFAADFRVERTIFLQHLSAEIALGGAPTRTFADDESVSDTGMPLWALRKEALVQILGRQSEMLQEIGVTDAELAEVWHKLRATAGLTEPADEEAWLTENGLTREAVERRLRDIVALQHLQEIYSRQIDLELPSLVAVLSAAAGGGRDG